MKKIPLLIFCIALLFFNCKPDKEDGDIIITEEEDNNNTEEETKEPHIIKIDLRDDNRDVWNDIQIKVNIDLRKGSSEAVLRSWENNYEYYYKYENKIETNIATIEISDTIEGLQGEIVVELYNADFWRFTMVGEYEPAHFPRPSVSVKNYPTQGVYNTLNYFDTKLVTPADKSKPSYYRLKYKIHFYY
jgi:hypothetical protein